MGCKQQNEGLKVKNETTLSKEDEAQIVELTKKHIHYANENNFERYSETMHPRPERIEEGTPLYIAWKDARKHKLEIKKIYLRVADNVGRPRVIADVEWTDRSMQVAYQKFGEEWKVAALD